MRRAELNALFERFVADIAAIIAEHAQRAVATALAERGLTPRRSRRKRRVEPLVLVPLESENAGKRRRRPRRPRAAAPGDDGEKAAPSSAKRAQQLTLF